MAKRVVGFGEVLGAIRPVGYNAFGDSNDVIILAGGSEANVLAKVGGLAAGIETQYVTKMKNDLVGRLLRYDMQKYKIGTDHVIWTDQHRNGLCFVEQGLGPITAEVSYDRADSAIAKAQPGEFDFSVLETADAFFVSGISAALSPNSLKNVELALAQAKEYAVPAFIDINYRAKLWSAEQARTALEAMIAREFFRTLIITETDARVVFGVDRGFDDDNPMEQLINCSGDILRGLNDKFSQKVPILIMTVRKRISNELGQWSTVALVEGKTLLAGDILNYVVLDRFGAGDSCSAGIIGGYLGVQPDGSINNDLSLAQRIQNGLHLGNRMSVVVQKTVSDLGPQWSAADYFRRVGKSREIAR